MCFAGGGGESEVEETEGSHMMINYIRRGEAEFYAPFPKESFEGEI